MSERSCAICDMCGEYEYDCSCGNGPMVSLSSLKAAEEVRNRWREEAWQCFIAAGEDPDGAEARHLNPGEALEAVRQLRCDGDHAGDELQAAEERVRQLEAALAFYARPSVSVDEGEAARAALALSEDQK